MQSKGKCALRSGIRVKYRDRHPYQEIAKARVFERGNERSNCDVLHLQLGGVYEFIVVLGYSCKVWARHHGMNIAVVAQALASRG